MYNINSGYSGYSMSNRAVEAYKNGEKPISKWTKEEIIDEVIDFDHFKEEDLKRFSKKVLADYFLILSSWHHTSSYFNQTDFYSVDGYKASNGNISELEYLKEKYKSLNKKREKVEKIKAKKVYVKYLVWSGTRKHPKAYIQYSYALLIGNWVYLPDRSKKSINANGFELIEEYQRSPKGTKKYLII